MWCMQAGVGSVGGGQMSLGDSWRGETVGGVEEGLVYQRLACWWSRWPLTVPGGAGGTPFALAWQ
jgi:hypothetical protein